MYRVMDEFVLTIPNESCDLFCEVARRFHVEVLCFEEVDDHWTKYRVCVDDPVDLFYMGMYLKYEQCRHSSLWPYC